jgi:hypothetical protein
MTTDNKDEPDFLSVKFSASVVIYLLRPNITTDNEDEPDFYPLNPAHPLLYFADAIAGLFD